MADLITKTGIHMPITGEEKQPDDFQREMVGLSKVITPLLNECPRLILDDLYAVTSLSAAGAVELSVERHAQRAIPPCPNMWAEFSFHDHGRQMFSGCLINMYERGEDGANGFDPGIELRVNRCCRIYENARWIVAFSSCLGFRLGKSAGPNRGKFAYYGIGTAYSQFDSIGAVISMDAVRPRQRSDELLGIFNYAVMLCCYGVSLMHHKSFEARPFVHPSHEIRNASRDGRGPLLSYKTLWVDCFERVKQNGVGSLRDSEFNDARQHLVAGHWKYYHKDRPLFGRPGQDGFIWHDAHVRGNAERGIVVKDYAIAAH